MAFFVKIANVFQNIAEMLRVVQLQSFAFSVADLSIGKDARQIVQPVTALRFVEDDQIAAQQFAQAFVSGVLANRFFRRRVDQASNGKLAYVYARDPAAAQQALAEVQAAFVIGDAAPTARPLIYRSVSPQA